MLRSIRAFAAVLITAAALLQHAPAAAQSKALAAEAVIGHYRFESGIIYSVEKSRNNLILTQSKQSGVPAMILSATPDGKFRYLDGAAYLTFDFDLKGVAETLHLHVDNNTLPAARINAEVAKKAADDFAAKIKNQTHDPACEQTLRRVIEELRTGKPDYSKMPPVYAMATQLQLPKWEKRVKKAGPVKDVKFKGVGSPTGREKFDVTFAGGREEWRIQCLANGWVGHIDPR